ncbi:hypothetical protein LCGC14_2622180 [marine sediment metagenome]|uniref:Uncharacterized protein n=1 Tax=marine sediment metagenome TaxID=412755 RepID=A0A0F9CVD3_9ZZZZ
MADTRRVYVRCILVETETEIPGLALIQLHDDQPPIHYVPLVDVIELTADLGNFPGGHFPGRRWVSTREPV